MEFIIDSYSSKSCHHKINEDSFICNDQFIIVADGMGGAACGELASRIATSAISSFLNDALEKVSNEDDIRDLAISAFLYADKKISEYCLYHPEATGMGTTAVLMILIDKKFYVAWCGDSRCYYCNPSKDLILLTIDHTYVQQLINDGKITEEESFTHPDNNLITRYIGGGKELCRPEFISTTLDIGGTIVLCSDGLSGYCKANEIEHELRIAHKDNLSKTLADLALRNGSDDDITIVTLTTRPKQQVKAHNYLHRLKNRWIHYLSRLFRQTTPESI